MAVASSTRLLYLTLEKQHEKEEFASLRRITSHRESMNERRFQTYALSPLVCEPEVGSLSPLTKGPTRMVTHHPTYDTNSLSHLSKPYSHGPPVYF